MSELKTNLQEILQEKQEKIIPENIKSGVTILGVNGTLETGTDTSDATAIADDIIQGKTAYGADGKLTGTLPLFPNTRIFTVDNAGVTDNTEDSILELITINTLKQTLDSNLNMKFSAPYSDIVTAIGLTTDKLVQGNTILGVEGTYEGDNINDYIAVPADMTTIKIQDCIKKIPLIDTSAVTNMNSMFYGCTSLTTIPQLDTSAVTSMNNMFYGCTSLTTIPQLDTSAVTDMRYMFYGCTSLTTIPQLDTSAVTRMSSMFNGCTSLTTIPQLDTSAVTTMDFMFYGCTSLTTIPQLDTSVVTNMNGMFRSCTSLSNDSLNNILAMLTNAIAYTGTTKTLKYIGLSETQATTCTTLSNWSACEAAGWTTGY